MADISNIAAALVKAQRNFESARKSSDNPHFRSKYAALDTCVDAVIGALNAEGIFLSQRTFDDPNGTNAGVTVETLFVHSSGEIFYGGRLYVPAAKQDPQGYGSALTYARRYSLLAACGIAPEDDDGNSATAAVAKHQPAPRPTPVKPEAAPELKDELWRKCLDAASGSTEAAELVLKAVSGFEKDGQEKFLTLTSLPNASAKWVEGSLRNFEKAEYKQKIADAIDSLPF